MIVLKYIFWIGKVIGWFVVMWYMLLYNLYVDIRMINWEDFF